MKQRWISLTSILLSALVAAPPAFSQEEPALFSTELPHEPSRPRSYLFPPLASLLLPGFDQWWENQNRSALAFTGAAVGGLMLAGNAASRLPSNQQDTSDLDTRNDDRRTVLLGSQIYLASGSLSAYTSFRTAVRSRKARGEFEFLKHEEKVDDILLAPFEMSLLAKPTTYVPLGLGLLLVGLDSGNDVFRNNGFTGGDFAFGSGFSYLAGTNEEALFRGWMMPVYMEHWQSPFWSNTATALVFSLAHLGPDNPLPWPQFALGWYLGWVTQKNEWTLKESIFIHTWWDVLAFTGVYLAQSKNKNAAAYLPLVSLTF